MGQSLVELCFIYRKLHLPDQVVCDIGGVVEISYRRLDVDLAVISHSEERKLG